jgi:hypothetical protein
LILREDLKTTLQEGSIEIEDNNFIYLSVIEVLRITKRNKA